MSLSIGVVMDPITTIKFHKDTTLALLQSAQNLGWKLFYIEPHNLFLDQGKACAQAQALEVFDNPQNWFKLESAKDLALGELDALLMRKDPPFDMNFIYSTYILEAAQAQGCLVVNDPKSLRDCNEKVFATQFPECCPPVLVSADMARLKAFHAEHEDVIFKPLDGMGGSSIFRCKPHDPNLGVILETLTQHGQQLTMAQRFIPKISEGDKRILMVDGEAIPYSLARIPAEGETRGNLAAGGRGVAMPLTEREFWIAQQVSQSLRERGLLFVGLDVIGGYLTEINVTSPTCVREIDAAYNTQIGDKLMHAIANKLKTRNLQS